MNCKRIDIIFEDISINLRWVVTTAVFSASSRRSQSSLPAKSIVSVLAVNPEILEIMSIGWPLTSTTAGKNRKIIQFSITPQLSQKTYKKVSRIQLPPAIHPPSNKLTLTNLRAISLLTTTLLCPSPTLATLQIIASTTASKSGTCGS